MATFWYNLSMRRLLGALVAGLIACASLSLLFIDFAPPTVESNDFRLIVMPDTQYYLQPRVVNEYKKFFDAQTKWIAENAATLRVPIVIHEGDVVDENRRTEWHLADLYMSALDGVVPYIMVPGNHDTGTSGFPNGNADVRDTTLFNEYFPLSRFAVMPTFEGAYQEGQSDNTYHTFTAGRYSWLVIGLEFVPRDDVLKWADSVIANHPKHNVIVVTHAYIDKKGRHDEKGVHKYAVYHEEESGNTGKEVFEKLVSKHKNILMVFNGHFHGQARKISDTVHGNSVYEMLANYQSDAEGGGGYLRIVDVNPDDGIISVKSYSPEKDHSYTNDKNEFSFASVQFIEP